MKAAALVFLAKCLRPLPDKWHGLTDVEIKYRQRYVDLIVSRGDAADVRGARAGRLVPPALLRRPRLPRGRDADDAAHPGRRRGAPVRDAPQRPRRRPLPPDRAGALPQAARHRRLPEGLRDQPELPERGDLHAAQPRVHDARVLHGLRRRAGPDGAHRGAPRRRRAGDPRDDRASVGRRDDLLRGAVPAALDEGRRRRVRPRRPGRADPRRRSSDRSRA